MVPITPSLDEHHQHQPHTLNLAISIETCALRLAQSPNDDERCSVLRCGFSANIFARVALRALSVIFVSNRSRGTHLENN